MFAVQVLQNERDVGFHKLQQVLDQQEAVLPNTATSGKERLRRQAQELQEDWDAILAKMADAKSRLEVSVTQWSAFSDSQELLARWLLDAEESVRVDSQLQPTLPEKQSQEERLKGLLKGLAAQQESMDSMEEKGLQLSGASQDVEVAKETQQILARYKTLNMKVQVKSFLYL